MGEINKSRLESVLMLKKISMTEIDKAINGGENPSVKFEYLLKDSKPIPKNVERKVLDYLLVEKNLDIKRYVYNETDDIDFDVKHNTKTEKKTSRVKNLFGAATKDVTMSDDYIANHINRDLVKARYKELGFTAISLTLFFAEDCNKKFFIDLVSPNKRKYLTNQEANNIGYLLETKYTSLVIGAKKHEVVTKYNVPEYAKYHISLNDDMVCPEPISDEFEALRRKLNISSKLLQNILENDFPIGAKFAELFVEAYNSVFSTEVTFDDIVKEFNTKQDLFYDNGKAEEVVIPPTEEDNTKIDIDNLPESWKESIKEPVKKEELLETETTEESDTEKAIYSCKCGHIKSNIWKANQLCPECNTRMRRAGRYNSIEFNTSVVDNATKEEPKSVDDMINEVLEESPNSSYEEEMANAEIENIIDTYNIHKDTSSIDKIYSVLKQIIKTEKALKYLDDYNEKQKKLLVESQLKDKRTEELIRFEKFKANQVVKEEVISPEYIINYIDEHFDSLIIDKMISVLQSKSKAKYNLEVADKLMGELNRAYNYSLEKDNEV